MTKPAPTSDSSTTGKAAELTPEKKKLRLDFTPSEMGMLLGISLRLEPDLKAKWDALLSRVAYVEPEAAREGEALARLGAKVAVMKDDWERAYQNRLHAAGDPSREEFWQHPEIGQALTELRRLDWFISEIDAETKLRIEETRETLQKYIDIWSKKPSEYAKGVAYGLELGWQLLGDDALLTKPADGEDAKA